MGTLEPIPREIADCWRSTVVLKQDLFSTVERGRFRTPEGEVDATLRRIDGVPWWTLPIARHFLNREVRALRRAGELRIAPPLLHAGRRLLVRGWIDGVPLHIAKPTGDHGYFREAKAALRALHRAGITHNDLAKEQNWLRTPRGEPRLTDFQLAFRFRRRGLAFRVAAYEDLRHLLKHKRRYVPDALTAAERRVLARKSLFTRVWMATGKKVYIAVTRGLFRFTDREGGGRRLVEDAPRIADLIKADPRIRDAAVVAYPDRRAGTGLYAFVEAEGIEEAALSDRLVAALGRKAAPERLQIVPALPRTADGAVRMEILQLVATNQVDLIAPLVGSEDESALVARIVAGRRNLRDRFAY